MAAEADTPIGLSGGQIALARGYQTIDPWVRGPPAASPCRLGAPLPHAAAGNRDPVLGFACNLLGEVWAVSDFLGRLGPQGRKFKRPGAVPRAT